ncbi:MAG: NYN domain-containing protein, partial [Phycisphaerales bacterium JB041]
MLLIDAFNVLHLPEAVAVGRALTAADLVSLIGTSRYAGQSVVLVCDGAGDGSIDVPKGKRWKVRLSGVEVVFSGPDATADDEIEQRLRLGGGGGITVISDDRRLRRAASRVRARSLGSGAFLAHLLEPGGRTKKRPVPEF